MKNTISYFFWILIIAVLASCKGYKQDIMFKLDDNFSEADLAAAVVSAERNYVIQINDQLTTDVFTNKGERIIDPNNELMQGTNMRNNTQMEEEMSYLVKIDGTAKFPIIGQVKVDSLTIDQAELLLQKLYDQYYKDSFVKLEYLNKRVVLFGAGMQFGQIIPLRDENLSLVEIIALGGGIEMGAKAQNIKLIRGSLNEPIVYQVDLTTIDGMKKSMLEVQPGDIIYIEPWRRPWLEAIKDITPVVSILTSTLALILVLQNLN